MPANTMMKMLARRRNTKKRVDFTRNISMVKEARRQLNLVKKANTRRVTALMGNIPYIKR